MTFNNYGHLILIIDIYYKNEKYLNILVTNLKNKLIKKTTLTGEAPKN